MEKIQLEVNINQSIDVEVSIGDVIAEINAMDMVRRWNYIAIILNECQTDVSQLSEDHKIILQDYLKKKSAFFKDTSISNWVVIHKHSKIINRYDQITQSEALDKTMLEERDGDLDNYEIFQHVI